MDPASCRLALKGRLFYRTVPAFKHGSYRCIASHGTACLHLTTPMHMVLRGLHALNSTVDETMEPQQTIGMRLGPPCQCKSLLRDTEQLLTSMVVTCTDMDITAEEAYEEAMTRIFDEGAEVHRFSMPNMSRKQPNKSRWTLFEMWPINVSTKSVAWWM